MQLLSQLKIYLSILLLQQTNGQNIRSICSPPPSPCNNASKYRSHDGTCNNLEHPKWGASYTIYTRLLPANYADGISAPPVAKDGSPLPLARLVSSTVHPTAPVEDEQLTLNVMQYGQILSHDMGVTLNTTASDFRLDQCCSDASRKLLGPITGSKHCFSIEIPKDDPDFIPVGFECLPFSRTTTDHEYGCGGENESVQQINRHTSFLDLSILYGVNADEEASLRVQKNGLLKSEHRLGQKWLPRSTNITRDCKLGDPKEPCYDGTGDGRVNQNTQLTILQTILLREHNRIADRLGAINPHWDDERTFQEARKIIIGQHQKIVYYDLLPLLIGEDNMKKHKLIYTSKDHVNDYDPTIDPSIINEHAAAAFRYFHTLINGQLTMFNEKRLNVGDIRISDHIDRPLILENRRTNFDDLTRGLATQSMLAADEYISREMTNKFGAGPGDLVELDLIAICIQRGRDHGLATYNDLRQYCGLPRANSFMDLLDVIKKENIQKLGELYKSPDDIDLLVGGSLEKLVPGARVGKTFLCIITEQFIRTRKGDRFFFENSGDIGFTLPQLREIRKASISRWLCDNTHIKRMQPNSFVQISNENKLVDCNDLPMVNLKLWKE
ncbi:unnamed protein product [Ceutorhynchus assimilis]|uniref:Peroxidase n=1 Tax=Ceutorhynchus assimilis TaxID=467358 RepID=A0A9N9QKJ4_9CUCU|nr:unnamed protein product [Ceutorhynchus assimilis]